MNPNATIRLLIINDSRDEAERLISMLNNAGRPSRPQHIDSEEGLAKLLQEQVWDLLIGHDTSQKLTPSNAIKQIKRLNKDVPVILQTDSESTQAVVEGLKLGATDVVRLDDDQHLLLVIQRELENCEQRRARRMADRQRQEAERRCQQLLDSSRDAIAYVQDGMFLYANESFAECFGYQDKDDIDCMPVIDMVAERDQDKIKAFLKEFNLKGDDAESHTLEFNGICMDGQVIPVAVTVAHAIYDEEPCTQLMIYTGDSDSSNAELEAELKQIKHQDLVTGLYNRHYLLDTLARTVNDSNSDTQAHALLHIDIDHFVTKIQPALGMAGSDMLLNSVANLLKEQCSEADTLGRFGSESFLLLLANTDADSALKKAENLCHRVEEQIFEIDGKTQQATVSIGVSLINETSSNAEAVVDQAIKASESVRQRYGAAGVGNGASLYEPPLIEEGQPLQEQEVLAAVQRALDKNRFRLLFQPIISLRGEEEEHYEVLLRMLDENDEEVIPSHFLEVAEKMGAITKIDRWVILEAIKLLSEHRTKGNQTRLIVNLSSQSLCDETLLPWLNVAFKAAKLPADTILFQVREVDATNHLNAAKAFAKGIKAMHSAMSISNFGCSLNPFNTLKHIDAQYIKVHGSFTLDIQNNNESPEALTQLIGRLHEQGKTTIVPYVENASVLSTLWQAGVHYIQGHYLQAPTAEMDYDFGMDE